MAFIDTSVKSAGTAFKKGNPVYIMVLTLSQPWEDCYSVMTQPW